MQSHKMTEVHTKGESKSIRSTGFSPSVLPVCGFLTRPLFFLSFWSTIPKEAARCGSFLPSLRASVPACVFAECMHHRISCKQICRNINRFRFTFEYLFYKLFHILFQSSFPSQLPHTCPVLPDPEDAEVSCDRSVHRSYPESA